MSAARALLGFAVTAAYWPGISGAATTPRWMVLMIGVPLLLFFADRIVMTLSHALGAVFVLWCLATLAWTPQIDEGIGEAIHLIVLAAAFALGSTVTNMRPLYAGAAVGVAISGAVATAEHLGLLMLPAYGYPAGMFFNSNTMGETAALVVAACMASRLWWGAAFALPALILGNGRGPLLALVIVGFVGVWWLAKRARMPAVASIVGLVLIVGAFALAPFAWRSNSISHRLAIWSDTARAVTLTGHGLGSFWSEFPKTAVRTAMVDRSRPARAHNEALDIAFEVGIIGIALIAAFVLTLFGPLSAERLVLIAVAVEACFAFPLHNPAAGFLAMVMAGSVARSGHRVIDAIGACRDRVRAWLARRRITSGIG